MGERYFFQDRGMGKRSFFQDRDMGKGRFFQDRGTNYATSFILLNFYHFPPFADIHRKSSGVYQPI